MYNGYYFWGMHLVWWFIWVLLLGWLLFRPYGSRKRYSRNEALNILQKRFASGEITREEYEDRKKVIEDDLKKHAP